MTIVKVVIVVAMIGIVAGLALWTRFMPFYIFEARKKELETTVPIIVTIAATIAIQAVLWP